MTIKATFYLQQSSSEFKTQLVTVAIFIPPLTHKVYTLWEEFPRQILIEKKKGFPLYESE